MNRNAYQIPRRTFLKGAGVSLALPFLEIMKPAVSHAKAKAAKADPVRLCVLYKGCGVNPHSWDIVGGTETEFELSKILRPLAPVQKDILVLGNLENQGSSDHMDAPGTFMSAARHRDKNRYSFDQRIADQVGGQTPIKSVQLTADNVWKAHPWLNILSYDKSHQPLRGQHDPQSAFDLIFKNAAQATRQTELASVLDGVRDASTSLLRKASSQDRQVLQQYFDSLRDVEKSIERARANGQVAAADPKLAEIDPTLEVGNLGERVKAMMDLITLAFWTDSTRVASCMLANTNSRIHYDFMGVNAEFHYVSHHVRNKKVLPTYDSINMWHTAQLRYLIEKMKTLPDGSGTLFDNSLILWGSGIKHGDYHSLTDLPVVLAGGGGGQVELGRHVRYPEAQPFGNLLLTLMKLMGALAESIGDSTGLLPGISSKANFKPINPDDGSWKITQSDGQTLTAKGLLRIEIEGEQEYYLLRLSDKSDLEIRIPFMNNHRLRFDRNVGKVVVVTGQYKVIGGKKTLVSLKAAKAPKPMTSVRSFPRVFLLVFMVWAVPSAWAAEFTAAAEVIEDRCLTCHDSDTKKGGIDLSPLLEKANASYGNYTRLWIRLENMVARGEMPPENKKPLAAAEKAAIQEWFHESFVLRDGKSHIGPTPLRRLTRYEFENTLEAVLAVPLKAPYRDSITGTLEESKITALVPSDIPGESGFDNDAHRLGALKPPLNAFADAANYALDQFRRNPAAIKAVLGWAEIPSAASEADAKAIISKFLLRAFRGNAARLPDYERAFHGLYAKHVATSKDSLASLLHVFEMILVSPEFLYRFEHSQAQSTPYPVNGLELATRLSYFLWGGPPDAELLKLGQDGSLLKEAVLKKQIARLLNSPKRIALSENFAGQWLGFGELMANREYLLNERWNRETYDEALFFFDELIRSNRSVLELVQSDWQYKRASALQAKGHGYQQLKPDALPRMYADIFAKRQSKTRNRKTRYDPPVLVQRQGDRDGGLLTSTAIMRVTSSKTRTSPIRRGVWVLNTLIGKSMEAPEDVPSIEEAREALNIKRNPTVAELLKQHVSKAVCHACHKEIDPLGLGLENFAQFGEWRTKYPDMTPVVASGEMPNGKAFESPHEMKTLLLEVYGDDIAKNFARQLFAYALGRQLQPYDRPSLDQIVSTAKQDGYKANTIIEQIVLSKQFRYRQDR